MQNRVGMFCLFAAVALGLGSAATARLSPGEPPRAEQSTDKTAPTHDPLLIRLAARLRDIQRAEHLPGTVGFDGDVLMMDVRTSHIKLHGTDMTGRESASLQNFIVPDAHGFHIELQIVPGDFIGQAVRPQTMKRNYHDDAGKPVTWSAYLGQYPVKRTPPQALLVNIEYGKRMTPEQIARLQTAIQDETEKP